MKKNEHAAALGRIKSNKKAASSRENGRKGGRPKMTAAEKAMARIDYWMQRRIEATTTPELEHARRMELKAIRDYNAATDADTK